MLDGVEEEKLESFNDLEISPKVLKGVDKAGYSTPFPIQERAIRPLLAGRDLIGQAKAGSGKTAAFGIPLLQSIDVKLNRVQALVLAPTRELAIQITNELQKLGAYTGVKVTTIYGGQSINIQLDALERGVHVVVGTPGRVIDHLKRGTLDLQAARFVVLDEADRMLDMGFIDDVDFILDSTSKERQLSLFSATMPRAVIELSRKYMKDPERVIVDENEPFAASLEQFFAVVERDEKLELLLQLLRENHRSTVIFCRTRRGTNRLARELERRYLHVVQLHGDLTQGQRDHSMRLFRSESADILVATDVASRGIDIRQVDCVINYDVPEDPVVYFHRVGRTARAGDSGKSYTFVGRDESLDFARILQRAKVPIKPLRQVDGQYLLTASANPRPSHERQGRQRTRRHGNRNSGGWRRYQ